MRKRSDNQPSTSGSEEREPVRRRRRSRPSDESNAQGDPWGLHGDPPPPTDAAIAGKTALTVGSAAEDARRATRARVPDLDVGDVLEVTVGKETFSPVKYHTFDVGPVTVRGNIREGEDAIRAYMRLYESALVLFTTEYETKCKGYLGRAVKAREMAQDSRIRVD